ncbi:cytochrome c3 family protein [[Eubacterium] cellulosolvens]
MKQRVRNETFLLAGIISIILILMVSSAHYAIAIETSDISCTDCHDKTMETHRFRLNTCTTCHSPDMSNLSLKSGIIIPIEYSDPLCVECHTDIFEAWMAGGHGLEGTNCVECHDPHIESLQFTMASKTSTSFSLTLKILATLGVVVGLVLVALLIAKKLKEK